jgi:undecaprenyl-diphosphatase
MAWWEAVILGLVQGLSEFLPISSSGHLVLGKYLLGLDTDAAENLTFDVFVHFGTVLSIITVYRHRVVGIVREPLLVAFKPSLFKEKYQENQEFRFALFILITLIPTGIVYVIFKDFLEARFGDPRFVCAMLIVTGILLLLTLLRPNPDGKLNPGKALLIGIAQSAAMIPGISRSGATICTALYQNVSPERATNFSFLMLLPVVLGATLIKSIEMFQVGFQMGAMPLIVGTLVAYLSGIAAIYVMIDFVKKGRLQYFAFYVFTIGILGLIFI